MAYTIAEIPYSEEIAGRIIELIKGGESDRAACASLSVNRKQITVGSWSWYERGRGENAAEPYLSFADAIDEARSERRHLYMEGQRAKLLGKVSDAVDELRRWYTEVLVGFDEYLDVDKDGHTSVDMRRLLADSRVRVKRISETASGKQIVEFYGADDAARGLERLLGVAEKIELSGKIEINDARLEEIRRNIAVLQNADTDKP